MGAFVMAWLVGEGIIVYRTVKANHAPPRPGQLIYSSGVFVLLALLAEFPKARPLAVTLAVGFDLAALLNLFQETPLQISAGWEAWPPPHLNDDVTFPNPNVGKIGQGIGSGLQQGIGGVLS